MTPHHREPKHFTLIICLQTRWSETMSEAMLILPNMRGGCATVGTTVHTLFRVSGRRPRRDATASVPVADTATTPSAAASADPIDRRP
jgi:hypothetical protein